MSRRGVVLFVAMGVIWGIPYLLIKVAVRQLDPVGLVFSRTALAALVLLPVAAARGQLRPVLARWRPLLAYTAAELAVPWVLLSTAEERLASSLTGLLVAAVPLVGVPVGAAMGQRAQLDARSATGLACGLVGVGALLGFDITGGQAGSVALVAVVVVGYATGPAIAARWLGGVPSLGVVALSTALCALAYAPFALASLPGHVDAETVWSVLVLALVCTALAFVLFFALIAEVGAVRATVITYLNPAVAVVLGVAFLGEGFGAGTALGFVLVLAGSWLATHRRAPPVSAAVGAEGGEEALDEGCER